VAPAPHYAPEAYDGEEYADAAGYGQDAEAYSDGHSDGYADAGHDAARAGGQHAEHRYGGGVHRPAAAPRVANGPLAGSVFDKSGWGTFMNELRERTVRRP
jgi:hypothetical protein